MPATRRFKFSWRRREDVRADVDEELQFHIEMRTRELIAKGHSPPDARAEALRQFGDVGYTRQYCIAQDERKEDRVRRLIVLDELVQDIRFALRRIRKSPAFAAVTIATLALGIGANTAVFTLVNAVLLRPLPYHDPDRLVFIYEGFPNAGLPLVTMSAPDIMDLQRMQRSYDGIGVYRTGEYELGGSGNDPERVTGTRTSAGMLPLVGVQPAFGRGFTAAEDRPGSAVVILSDALWRRRFGARSDVIGTTVVIDRQPHEVIGVMPRGLAFPPTGARFNGLPADILLPIAFTGFELEARGMMFNNSVVGRLKPGVSLEQARAELPALTKGISAGYPAALQNSGIRLVMDIARMHDEVVGNVRAPLLVLLGSVGLVLLIACANIANLFVGRAAARDHEMTVRVALGASRLRLRKMLLTESLILALAGGAAGYVLAWWATDALPQLLPASLAQLRHAQPDGRVLAFTMGASLLTALLFGLAPLATRFKPALQQSLRESGGAVTMGRARQLTQKVLVVTTVTLAAVLLVAAGLLLRSFSALLRTDLGFRPESVLTATVSLPASSYDGGRVRGFYAGILERVRALPGVATAGLGNDLPLAGFERRAFTPENSPVAAGGPPRSLSVTWVASDYFGALGIGLRAGRLFSPADERVGADRVVIVSEGLSRDIWPGVDPIGKRLKWGLAESQAPWMTVVGVVADVPEARVDAEPTIHAYVPLMQIPAEIISEERTGIAMFHTVSVIVRSRIDPAALAAPIREEIRRLDPALAISDVSTMSSRVAGALAPQRLSTMLLAVFAAAALMMASIGLYGVLAYSVAQRTREIGVRIALGAKRNDVVKLVAGQGLKLTALGLALGLTAAFAGARVMTSLLYNTTPRDAVTFLTVPLVIGGVALAASYLPARRAANVDPIRALRVE
jgi:putative ABC transport system permease protein